MFRMRLLCIKVGTLNCVRLNGHWVDQFDNLIGQFVERALLDGVKLKRLEIDLEGQFLQFFYNSNLLIFFPMLKWILLTKSLDIPEDRQKLKQLLTHVRKHNTRIMLGSHWVLWNCRHHRGLVVFAEHSVMIFLSLNLCHFIDFLSDQVVEVRSLFELS